MLPIIKSKKKQKSGLNFSQFDAIKVTVASPEQIHEWSHGEVKKPETINYRTFKPERDGLFCEKIFGPVKNLECHCGKYKTIRYKGVVCDRCGVEVIESKYRRERFGHIDLAYPVSHIWFLRKSPSKIGLVLNMKMESLVKVVYFTHYVVLEDLEDKGRKILSAKEVISTSEYEELYQAYGPRLKADIGSEPIRKLLEAIDLDKEISEIRSRLKNVRIDEIDEYLNKWDEFGKDSKRKEELIELFRFNPIAGRKIPNIFRALKECKDKRERRDYLIEKSGSLLTEADRSRSIKRLRILEGLKKNGIRPEWMVLTVLPVIPPDLRPLVPLEGGRFASSDLNDLYRRILNRNNRLKHTMQLHAPSVIINNEKRLLQEAVDALFDNESRPHPITAGANNRPLKSLSEALRGKQGRFRQNLLGKRVDYSGRSVIVVGPELKLNQCGLPKQMALNLFHPFVLRELLKEKHGHQKASRKMLEIGDPVVWSILENVIKDRPVLLNRAPTLHRLGIQAFEPVLIEGKAIQLHPLTCAAFNADFDGDQMAVHVPLSIEAQVEARVLMMATNNIFSPASGRPIAVPSQDMILGCAYLTLAKKGVPGEGMIFSSVDEVMSVYQRGKVDLQAIIKVEGINKIKEDDEAATKNPQMWKDYTTVGRVIFNTILPEGFGYVNKVMTKKEISRLLDDCYNRYGMATVVKVLDDVKKLGFRYATRSGVSISIDQMNVPEQKNEIIKDAYKKVKSIISQAQQGLITEGERYSKILDVWSSATDKISDIVFDDMKKLGGEKYVPGKPRINSIYLMADSGARGNRQQVRQLAGIRGLMARPQRKIQGAGGEIIETPVVSNFREGLSVLEYFISTHGGRKGLSDTALKTADAGYLTRRLVDVAHSLVVTMEDCGTIKGIALGDLKSGEEIIETMEERITGRYPVENVTDLITTEVLASRDEMITPETARKIADSGIEKIRVRSVLTCEAPRGVCARCYGKNLATNKLAEIGDAVGIIAAQSIGEPGTQLTLRTFHVGGAASKISLRSEIIATDKGEIEYQNLKYVKDRDGNYVVISRDTVMVLTITSGGARRKEAFTIPYGAHIKYVKSAEVVKDEKLADWDPHYKPIISEFSGRVKLEDVKQGVTLRLEKSRFTGLIEKTITSNPAQKELRPRITIIDDNGEPHEYPLLVDTALVVSNGDKIEKGDILAKIPHETIKIKDITGGLPRVEELFEARKPKNSAIISEIDGKITIDQAAGEIIVEDEISKMKRKYSIPPGRHALVYNNDKVIAGEPLTDGAINPHDLLKVKSEKDVQEYLVNEIQQIYRTQGVTINDRHIEVIVRQMLSNVRITDPGDSEFIIGEITAKRQYQEVVQKLEKAGKKPPQAQTILLGVTKASLASESFISAASFQETTKVLAEAATTGQVDTLVGLKENVSIGHLIPAGTGLISHSKE